MYGLNFFQGSGRMANSLFSHVEKYLKSVIRLQSDETLTDYLNGHEATYRTKQGIVLSPWYSFKQHNSNTPTPSAILIIHNHTINHDTKKSRRGQIL